MFSHSLEFSMKFVFNSGAKTFHFRRKKRKKRCRSIWARVSLVTWHWCAKNLKHSIFCTSYIKLGVREREVIARKYYRFGSMRWITFKNLSRWQWSVTTSVGKRLLLKIQAKHSFTQRQASLKNMPTINDCLVYAGYCVSSLSFRSLPTALKGRQCRWINPGGESLSHLAPVSKGTVWPQAFPPYLAASCST